MTAIVPCGLKIRPGCSAVLRGRGSVRVLKPISTDEAAASLGIADDQRRL
jgi:hypothetical protein